MSVSDEIGAERQRLTERLARIDAERQKLADEMAELDAAERVLSRMMPTAAAGSRRGRRPRSAEATDTATATKPARRGRPRATGGETTALPGRQRSRGGRGGRKPRAKPEVPLGDAALQAIEALGNEVSAEQVREYLGQHFGMQVRANHLGMALQRHRRAGRLSQDDGRWSMGQSPEDNPAPV